MASSLMGIIPGKHKVTIDEMMREAGRQGAANMASNQQVIIPWKHQVIIDEMITGVAGDVVDMLKKNAGKQGLLNDMSKVEAGQQEVIVNDMPKKRERNITQVHGIATVSNLTLGDLQLVRGDEFAPGTIRQGGYVSFVTKNSKGHVIYDGTNVQGGPHNCAWLLAWCMHSDGYGNQVYVECGPRGNITAMPDYQIYKNMDAFGSLSTYVDPKTNTDASARIQAICTTPKLGCVFDLGGNRS